MKLHIHIPSQWKQLIFLSEKTSCETTTCMYWGLLSQDMGMRNLKHWGWELLLRFREWMVSSWNCKLHRRIFAPLTCELHLKDCHAYLPWVSNFSLKAGTLDGYTASRSCDQKICILEQLERMSFFLQVAASSRGASSAERPSAHGAAPEGWQEWPAVLPWCRIGGLQSSTDCQGTPEAWHLEMDDHSARGQSILTPCPTDESLASRYMTRYQSFNIIICNLLCKSIAVVQSTSLGTRLLKDTISQDQILRKRLGRS